MDSLLLRRKIFQAASGGEKQEDRTLTFTAEVNNSYVRLCKTLGANTNCSFEYSIDNGKTWQSYTITSFIGNNKYAGTNVKLAKIGDSVKFRGICPYGTAENSTYYYYFNMSGKIAASGDLTSIINGIGGDAPQYQCYYLFKDCTALTKAPNLPSTQLNTRAYAYLFYGCTGLTTPPELPATTLAASCYNGMFYGCTGLIEAPVLSATTLVSDCYSAMFRNCTSLTTAPELPALTLVSYCYFYMFTGCTNLNYVKAMFTTQPNANFMSNWLDGVAATGTFVKNSAAEWTGEIPSGWTVETASE